MARHRAPTSRGDELPAPLPLSPSVVEKRDEGEGQRNKGFRGDYDLGDSARASSHMIVEPTSKQALQAAGSLNKHDFAFVKRSDGSCTYAILAY